MSLRARLQTRLRRLFAPEGFRGPVLTLLSGTSAVMALAYLALPLLTRLYTDAEFGVADYFSALLVVLVSFTSLRYDDALMLPEDDDEAAAVLALAVGVLLVFTGFFTLLLPWRVEIAAALGMPGLAPWLWLVPPTLLVFRGTRLAEAWLTRVRRFRPLSAGQVTGTLASVTTRLGAGVPPVSAGAGGLIVGFVVGYAASAAVQGTYALRHGARRLWRVLDPAVLARLARRYRRFPLYTTPSVLLATLGSRLPVLLLPFFFEAAVIGRFGRAFAVLAIPLGLVGGAVARVFFVHAAEARREGRLAEVTGTVHRRLVMLGLFPTLALLLAGPDVFEVVFGAPWREAGRYVQWIGPWLFLAVTAASLTSIFDVLERQRLDFLTSLLISLSLATALVAGGRTGDVRTTLLLVGAVGSGTRVVQLVVLLRLAGVRAGEALRPYARYLLFGAPGLLLVATALSLDAPWLTAAALAGAGLLYGGLVLWKDRLLEHRG